MNKGAFYASGMQDAEVKKLLNLVYFPRVTIRHRFDLMGVLIVLFLALLLFHIFKHAQ